MAEEHTQQPSSRGKSRRERVEHARSRDILDVASELNMELVRSGRDYRWKEHDSMVISPDKNMWNWFSRHQGGDVISLVETMKEVNFNQAIDYLNDGSFKEYTVVERVQEPFSYYLEPYEQPFEAARTYLKEQRSLSDETIDFFLDKGVLAQANAKVNGSIEPVVVFKSFDFSGEIAGATLQGIEENWEKWPERGYAKNIVRNSDGITGLHVDIGQPNRLIFAESAIDLMSYYELHKDSLQDVRLVSMDGVKEAVVGRHLAQLQSELSGRPLRWSHDQLAEGLQTAIDNNFFTDGKHADWITLAVDNDTGGHNFIDSLREKGATINEDLPDLQPGQDKTDWNDALKQHKILGLSDGRESYQTRSEEQGVLFENLTDVTSTSDHVMEPELQVVFRSSDENFISNKYSSGEVIDYDVFVRDLYTENNKRLEAAITAGEELPVFPTVTNSFAGGTWFDLQDENGRTLVKNLRYDIGAENETISERLDNILSSDYLEIAQHADAVYPKPALPETVNQDSGILVHLYTGHQQFGTIDFNDLFNNSDLGSLADELGYGWAIDPKETFAVIHDETLTQTQIDKIIDRMFDTGVDGNELKQYLQNPNFSLRNYAETGHTGFSQPQMTSTPSAEETEKPLEVHQGQDVSEQQKNERMYQRKGSLQPEAEGSTSPVLETSTFERSVTSRPTVSSQYLNFTIKDGFKSRKTKYEKSIDAYNLGKLNRRGVDIQEAAQFYLNELANSTVHYFTSDGSLVQVNFLEENFLHLTGLKIIGDAATPEKVLHDFANGGELSYDDIRLKNTESPFDKIKVLPDLETVLQTDSFYFDDLQDIPRYQGRFDSLIKSDDSDLMILFRMNTEDGTVPVSVFKARQVLRVELQEARKNEILGIFREKGGLIEQIDINKNYVKDDGEEMLSILKNRQYEESRDINDQSMNVSSYSFNHQDYSDIDSLLEAGSAYLQTTEGQEWLARDPEYHQELLDVFESAGATPKQKLEVMSEFGNIQVNGYDIVAGLGYSEALSDDALFLDQNIITEITEQGFVQEKPIQTRIDQQVSQQQLESLRNYFSGQMDKVEIGIGHSGAGVDYRAYYLRNSYDNRIEIAATDLGSELSPEEQLDALMNKIVENYGKPFWDLVQQPDFELSDEEAHQLAYPIVTQESLSEVFGYSPDVITEEELQTPEPISAELFTQVLDSAYNVGDPRKLGLQVPEESKRAWERYYELSDSYEGNFSAVVDAADQLSLVDKNSNFYQDWQQDQIYNDTYHVRLRGSNEGPISTQWPFEPTHLVSYQDFVTELYKANQDASQTQPIAFDIYAPGGALIKDGVRYAVGDETQPVSRLLGLGYRRLEDYPNLAAIDEEVLSQLENQEVNQDIAAEANEQTVASPETPQERDSREVFQSPKQSIKTGLAQRVEEIMAEDATKILVSSIPKVQENLSVEGDLIGAFQPDGQMLYTNQEDFGRDYQLELSVHSPVKIDQLSDIQAPWTLALIQGEQKLGYLAYGSDWGNDFQVKKELEQLASQIGTGNSPEGLYQQEEIDAFLTNIRGQEPSQRTQENISSAEPFDYKSASAYEISERAFQKIREYTQSPEDLMEYVEFISKFPQLSPRNVALIQEQWRGANAVATYDQWQSMGEALGIKPEDVIQTKATYINKRTGETKEVVHQGLSVKTGEKSQITLFRPLMVRMIPVIDENGNHVKNDKGNPKYKKFSDATPQEKELVKEGKLPVRQFQERDPKTGQPRFTTYKVFELSQTTLKPESYPKAMPNRHYNFDTDKVKTKEVLEGLCDYAESIGVSIMKDEAHVLGNAKGAFFPGEQLILINPDNTPGEKIATTIHELAHATLHNPNLADQYKELSKVQKELEAEMTSHLLSKHFGLDTTEKAIDYMAKWTDNLQGLNDKQLADSLKRIHKTVSKMHKQIEHHTKPYQLGKNRGQGPNFTKAPTKGPSR